MALSCSFHDKARYWPKIVIFSNPLAFDGHKGGPRRNIVIPFGVKKTRMTWLPDGEKSSRLCLAILTEYRRVTDRQTSRDGIVCAMHSIAR